MAPEQENKFGAGARKQVWHPHVRTWVPSEANLLYWSKYMLYCWDFVALRSHLAPPGV